MAECVEKMEVPVCDTNRDERDVENTAKFYLEAFEAYIRSCLSTSDLKDLIVKYDKFDHDEKRRLSHYEEKKTPYELFDEIVKAIRNMKDDCLKYTALAVAFKKMGNEKTYLLLNGAELPNNDTHRKLLCKSGDAICNMLNVGTILPNLIAEDLVSAAEIQLIEKTLETKGNWSAAFELWKCLPNKKVDWYPTFMEILLKNKHDDLANIMNKELRQMAEAGEETCVSMAVTGEHVKFSTALSSSERYTNEAMSGPSSVREHVISDSEEAEVMNEGAPPPIPKRFDSLNESEGGAYEQYVSVAGSVDNTEKGDIWEDDSSSSEDNNEEGEEYNLASDFEDSNDEDSSNSQKLILRDYQLELAENALAGKNTVIVAGTGSGKTWVALHIVKEHFLKAEQGTHKVAFMARTSALIKQQADRFKRYLPEQQTKLVTGENEESNNLGIFIQFNDILCFTPQILVNNLDNRSIKSLSEFSLIILDECHHTKGDEPYNMLMRKYLIEKTTKRRQVLPQVVGLTASIGVGKSHNDEDACDYLLRVFASLDVRVLSTVQRCIDKYEKITTNPTEVLIQMVIPKRDLCMDILLDAIHETEEKLQEFTLLNPAMIDIIVDKCPPKKQSQEYTKWTVDVEKIAINSISDDEMLRNVRTCAIYLNVYNAAIEVNSLLGPTDVITFLATKHKLEHDGKEKLTHEEKDLLDKLIGVQKRLSRHRKEENPNVRRLSDILRKMMNKNVEESRAMVFVKARATCIALASFLKGDFKDTDIAVHDLYGKDTRGGIEGMTESIQNDTVEKFRNGYYKILVATSVGMEGIDVPDCNIVLNYNFLGNEITKIQMKGRSRKKEGHHVIMGNEKQLEHEGINAYKLAMMQRALKRFLVLDPKIIDRKVSLYQKEEMSKYTMRKQIDEAKRSRKSTEGDFEIRCRRCNTLACYTSDIRMVKCQYIVIDKSFEEKIILKPHKRPKMYDGFYKKFKMYCKKCPLDWGIVSENKGLPCRTLKLECFKLRNMQSRHTEQFKKWEDVPIKIPEIDVDDLTRLLGEIQNE